MSDLEVRRLPRRAHRVGVVKHLTLGAALARRTLSVAVFLASSCGASASRAQHVELRGIFSANVQGTDNVNLSPMNGPEGARRPAPAFIANLSPAVVLSYETPRWLHELQYSLNLATMIGGGQQYNYTNRLEARSRHDVSELTRANFALRLAQGQVAFYSSQEPGKPVEAFVPGTYTFVTGELVQGIRRQLSERAAFDQSLTINAFRPVTWDMPRPAVYGANLQLALRYDDEPDDYGASIGTQLGVTEQLGCNGGVACGDVRLYAPILASRAVLEYSRDFLNGFHASLEGGVQQAMRLSDGGGQSWQPVGRAAIQYHQEEADVQLTLSHGAQLNPNVGGLVMATSADLLGAIPLDRRTRYFMLQLQTGYQRGTPFDASGALLPGFHVAASDVGLVYRPERWLPNLAIGIRYSFRLQITEARPSGLAETGELYAIRNAVLLDVGFEFPERKPTE
jgi:hypothetical protein